jgi:hypothetical protein
MLLPCVTALLLGVVSAVQAQDACSENFKWPKVGTWAQYTGTYNGKPTQTRYAVVGTEERKGADYKWIEIKTHDERKNKDMVYQFLVPGRGPLEMEGIEEMVMKVGDDPAMKLPEMMLQMMRGQLAKSSVFKDACAEAVLVGKEDVVVPAGAFKAKHYHSEKYSSDSWVDSRVPFSMLKSVGKKHEILLVETGTGAASSIAEPPTEMKGMGQPE